MLCKGSEVQMILLPLSVTLLLAIGAADAAMAADEPSDTELAQKTPESGCRYDLAAVPEQHDLQLRSARANLEGDDFSRFLLQCFVNYNLPGGWYLVISPIMTADWEGDHDAWTVPLGGGFGKIHRFGKLPVNFSAQAFYNAEKTEFGGDWSTRFQVQLLFPC